MSNCPTCGRRPSERVAHSPETSHCYGVVECTDPCHDLADAGPELYEALKQLLVCDEFGDPMHETWSIAEGLIERLEAKR